jgi:putative glutamine amidotransferase
VKPIIGINCDFEEGSRLPYSFVNRDYPEAVIAAGGIPLLLPIIRDRNDVKCLLEKIDGLLLTGGNDVPPQRYRQERRAETVCVHPDKDISDSILTQTALQMKKPILAICYGTQLVNVSLGGSLFQDIPSEYKTSIVHRELQDAQYTHSVRIEKDSFLYEIVGVREIKTNSSHHQAVHTLGRDLKDTAHTEDGIIEAIECRDYPFLVGVQWHPERMVNHPCHAALFKALVYASLYRPQ